jgi:hypothetical protein
MLTLIDFPNKQRMYHEVQIRDVIVGSAVCYLSKGTRQRVYYFGRGIDLIKAI